MKNYKIYLFGDSICFGQLVNHHITWVSFLSRSVDELKDSKYNYIIQNCGINGNTTRQGLERLNFDVTSHTPDIVLIQFGINDSNHWATDKGLPRVSPKSFLANLEEIIDKLIISGTKHCFLNTNHPIGKANFNFESKKIKVKSFKEHNKSYNNLIRKCYFRKNLLEN